MRSEPRRQTSSQDLEELVMLRARNADLQSKVNELTGRLQMKELEAENQVERSDCLEIMLKKLGEKDDTTELLLSELTEENQELTRKLLAAQDSLMDKEHLIRNMEERCEELEEQALDMRRLGGSARVTTDDSQQVDELLAENDQMREELYQARELAQNLERDLVTRTMHFEQRLASVEKERDLLRSESSAGSNDEANQLRAELSQARQLAENLERDLATRTSFLAAKSSDEKTETLQTENTSLRQTIEALEFRFTTTTTTFNQRLATAEHERDDLLHERDALLQEHRNSVPFATENERLKEAVESLGHDLSLRTQLFEERLVTVERERDDLLHERNGFMSFAAENERLKEAVESLGHDLSLRTQLFEERLVTVERERDDLRNSLIVERSKSSFFTGDVEAKQDEVAQLEEKLLSVVDAMKVIYPSFLRGLQDVEYQVEGRLQDLDARLAEASEAVMALPAQRNEMDNDSLCSFPISREMLEQTLRDTQLALQNALDRHQDDEDHIERQSEEIQRLRDDNDLHYATIQDLERQVSALRNSHAAAPLPSAKPPALLHPVSTVSAVEVSDLKARLCAVESRAEKAAGEHAKLYAQHVRMIGYLESECCRLRGLGDHFRAMNVRLMSDLKKAKLQGLKCRGLENRVTILAENEKKLLGKLQAAERALVERNEEVLALIREKESEERVKAIKFDEEIGVVHDQIDQLHRQLQDAAKSYEALLSKYHSMEHDYKHEIHQLQLQCDQFEHESMLQNRNAEDMTLEINTLAEQLKERELQLSQHDMKLVLLSQESEASLTNYEHTIKELSSELEEKLVKVETLEETLFSMKSKISLMEEELLQRNKDTTTKLLEKTAFENELQMLRDALQEKVNEWAAVQQENALLSSQLQSCRKQLEALETRYHEITEVHLKQMSERALKAENAYHLTFEELTLVKEELIKQDELLVASRSSLEEVEGTLQKVQNDYILLETNEQVYRASNETLVEENETLRSQIQEVLQQLSTLNQKHLGKDSDYNKLMDKTLALESNLTIMARKEDEYKSALLSYEKRERLYIDELETITTVVGAADDLVDSSFSAGGDSASPEHQRDGIRDLLASPLPTDLVILDSSVSVTSGSVTNEATHHLSSIKAKTSSLVQVLSMYKQKQRALTASMEVLAKEVESYKGKVDKVEGEKSHILDNLHKAEGQVKELQDVTAKLRMYIATEEGKRTKQLKGLVAVLVQYGETLQATTAHMMKCVGDDTSTAMDLHAVLTEFREIHNVLTVRDDLCNGAADSNASTDAPATEGALQEHVGEYYAKAENLYLLALQVVQTYRDNTSSLSATVDELQATLERKDESHAEELEDALQRLRAADEDKSRVEGDLETQTDLVEALQAEISGLKTTQADALHREQVLDQELQHTLSLNQDLTASLKSLEQLNHDLSVENKALGNDMTLKEGSIKQLQEQTLLLRKRINETDLQFEKLQSTIQRLRGEKEALDNVIQSLESELDRSRAEYLSIMSKYNPSTQEDRGYIFELEKLLAALHSTSDQIEENFNFASQDVNNSQSDITSLVEAHLSPSVQGSSGADSFLEVQRRVEHAVTRLTRIRTRSREEGRCRKMLERQQAQLQDEVKKLLQVIDGHERALNGHEKEAADLKANLGERDEELHVLNSNLLLYQTNESEIKDKYAQLELVLNDARKENIQLSEDLQNKISEHQRLARALESHENTITKLQNELHAVKLEHQQLLMESEQRDAQLRTVREEHQQVLLALEQGEHHLARERSSRNELEHKLHQDGGGGALKSQVLVLTTSLQEKEEMLRSISHLKILQEEKIHSLEQELILAKQQIATLESRIEATLREKLSITDEVQETKRKIQQAKESYEQERSLRMRSEAAMNALRRVQDDDKRKINLEGLVTIRNNESESLHLLAEEEKRLLRSKIQELKMLCDEKEILLHHEVNDKKRLEKELESLTHVLAKKNGELNVANQYLQAYRKEGREVRKEVLDAVQAWSEVLQSVSLDLQLGFVDLYLPSAAALLGPSSAGADVAGVVVDGKGAKLGESLCVNVLQEVTAKGRELLHKYMQAFNRFKAQVQQASDYEKERQALMQQITLLHEENKTVTLQFQEDKRVLQAQLLKLKNDTETGSLSDYTQRLLQQIQTLEGLARKEKERKERALQELKEMRTEVDRLTGSNLAVKDRTTELGDEAQALQQEVRRLSANNHSLQIQAQTLVTQQGALQELVDQQDRQIRALTDPSAAPSVHAHGHSHGHNHSANTSALNVSYRATVSAAAVTQSASSEWTATRYQLRCRAMEELAAHYLHTLQTLVPLGPLDQRTLYAEILHDDSVSASMLRQCAGWVEREMRRVSGAFDEELRALDNFVQDLQGKLKERHVYETELRRQLEDMTKAFYRSSSAMASAADGGGLSQQLLALRKEVERCHSDMHIYQEELMKEKQHSRVRHVKLVEDLTQALEGREVALLALRRLELHCRDRGVDVRSYALFEDLQREAVRSSAAEEVLEGPTPYSPLALTPHRHSSANTSRLAASPGGTQAHTAVTSMIRNLIEADQDLQETERERRAAHGRVATTTTTTTTSSTTRLRSASNSSRSTAGAMSASLGGAFGTPEAVRQRQREDLAPVGATHSQSVEGTLTETFLTNRTNPSTGARGARPMGPPSQIPMLSRQIPSAGGNFALPTSGTGASFLRVARSDTR